MKKLFYFAALVCVAASCQKEVFENNLKQGYSETQGNQVTLYASIDKSKTALQQDLSVFWELNDCLAVSGDTLHYFKSVGSGSSSVPFVGNFQIDSVTVDSASVFYAVYPNISFDGRDSNIVKTRIPNVQKPVVNGYDRFSGVAVGKLIDSTFVMSQVSALLKFTITSSDIASITINNAAGAKIAGTLPVTFSSDGTISLGEAELTHILVIPSEGKTFAPGTYFIDVAPAALTGGIEFKFMRSDCAIASKVGANPVTFKRAQVMNFGSIDNGLSWNNFFTEKVLMNFIQVDSLGNFTRNSDNKYTYVHPFKFPEKFSTGISTGVLKGEDATLIANADNECLKYNVHSTTGFAKHAMGMRWGKGLGDYIEAPKIKGLTLQAVRLTMGGSPGAYQPLGYLSLNANGAPVEGGEVYKSFENQEDCLTWFIAWPDSSKNYRITTNNEGEVDLLRWEFFYSGKAEAMVTSVNCSVEKAEGSNATFKGSFSTFRKVEPDEYICGFDYKYGANDWTSVDADPDFNFSYDADFIIPGTEYTLRSWVNIGEGKVYSESTTFTNISKVEYVFDFSKTSEFESYGEYSVTTSDPKISKEYTVSLMSKSNNNVLNLLYKPQSSSDYNGILWASNGLKFSKFGSGSNIRLPVLNGLTLEKIEIAYGEVTGSTKHGIFNAEGQCISHNKKGDDGAFHDGNTTFSTTSKGTEVFKLSFKEATPYYLQFASNKDKAYVNSIKVTYTGEEAPTAQLIGATTNTSGSLSAQLYFNSVTKDSDITAGFEKESATAGEYTTIATGTCTTLANGRCTVTGQATLVTGDKVRAWVSFDGGVTKVSGPVLNIE